MFHSELTRNVRIYNVFLELFATCYHMVVLVVGCPDVGLSRFFVFAVSTFQHIFRAIIFRQTPTLKMTTQNANRLTRTYALTSNNRERARVCRKTQLRRKHTFLLTHTEKRFESERGQERRREPPD